MTYRVAVLGATGLVGRTLLEILEQRSFPVGEIVPLASARSAGETVPFRGEEVEVRLAEPDAFEGVDVVLSSAGGAVSRELLPEAAARGAVSIDNTSAFRMEDDVPLVVPECNPHRIADYGKRRIIANPNCSTIQLVVALQPLHQAFGLQRVHVATYQSVSGAGAGAVQELLDETRHELAELKTGGDTDLDADLGSGGATPFERREFPKQIAFNPLPHIDVFLDDPDTKGETKEEWKMRVETPKILEIPVKLHATCVRVPVMAGHSEAVWIETERPIDPDEARQVLRAAPGVEVIDDPQTLAYPTAIDAEGKDPVYVGRIRRDPTTPNGLAFWCVADNLRKGAALNAVQIAEGLVELWQREGR